MGQKAKWDYFRAIYQRYRQADRKQKHAILNELCVNTGYHQKYAIRLWNGPPPDKAAPGAGRTRRRGLSYSRIVMRPVLRDEDRFYVAEGEWDLLGNDKGRHLEAAPGNLEMVA